MNKKREEPALYEISNATSHGIAALLSVAGVVLLIIRSTDVWQTVAFSVYGACLILLFLFSTLFHALNFTGARQTFQVFDYAAIFLLIAGTYTPYLLINLHGSLGWIYFGIIWGCALLGITFTSIWLPIKRRPSWVSLFFFIVMGWVILLAIWPLYHSFSDHLMGFWLLLSGGLAYTVGAFVYSQKFPYAHLVWHLFVMLGAGLMWWSIYGFVGK